jgi:NHLM bacteriocin system ABC transporter ATP-binding protein
MDTIASLDLPVIKQQQLEMGFRILIHNPDVVIRIESGELDLFLLKVSGDTANWPHASFVQMSTNFSSFLGDFIEGSLRFLSSRETNDIVFSFPYVKDYKVIAKATIPTVFSIIDKKQLFSLSEKSPDVHQYVYKQQRSWIDVLSRHMERPMPHFVTHNFQGEGDYHLAAKESVSLPRYTKVMDEQALALIEVRKGSLAVSGEQQLLIKPGDPPFPMVSITWLEAIENSDIVVRFADYKKTTIEMNQSIEFYHSLILHEASHQEVILAEQGARQIAEREVNNRVLVDNSLRSIGNILYKEESVSRVFSKNGLFRACQLLSNYLEVSFVQPIETGESFSEQLYHLSKATQIHYRIIHLRDDWYKGDLGPIIGIWEAKENKPVALIPNVKGKYFLYDPDDGVDKVPVDEGIAKQLSSEAAIFYRRLPQKKTLNWKDLLYFCFKGRGYDAKMLVFTGFLGTLMSLFLPFASKILFDIAIPESDTNLLYQLMFGLFLAFCSSAVFIFIRETLAVRLETLVAHDLQTGLWQRVLDLPMTFFRRFEIGDLIQRIFSVSIIRKTISGQVTRFTLNALFAFLYVLVMLYYSPILTVVGIGIFLFVSVLMGGLFAIVLPKEKKIQTIRAEVYNKILQMIRGISKFRSNGFEAKAFSSWAKVFTQQKTAELKKGEFLNIIGMVSVMLPPASLFFMFAAGAYHLRSSSTTTPSDLSIGDFLAFYIAYVLVFSCFSNFLQGMIDSIGVWPLWESAKVFFDAHPELEKNRIKLGRLQGKITVENLNFRYDAQAPYVLSNVSFRAEPGEMIGLVGHSGSGKSTLLRLLLGFEFPSKGAIYYDDKDLAILNLQKVREQLGVVLQTTYLIEGTVRENVSASRLASDDDILDALRLAGFEEDLKKLPMGLSSLVTSGGSNFSGGQRQRLLIARALVKKPKCLFLDEATNALDNLSQKVVSTHLSRMNITRIVVAHRLTTLRYADRIYVLEKSKIVQVGTFNELSKEKGLFANMLKKQIVNEDAKSIGL